MSLSAAAERVLSRLEERSAREKLELDALNARGAAWTRAAAPRLMLDVGPDVGRLLSVIVRRGYGQRMVEIGGSVGYSTIWLGDAAAATGGEVITIENDDRKVAELIDNVAEAGLASHVQVIHGSADAVIPDLPDPFDVVLIDHWKDLYVREFDLCWPRLRPSGVIVADNILRPEATADLMRAYVAHVRSVPDAWTYTLPLGDGVEITGRNVLQEENHD